MGLLSLIRKLKRREREIRILMVGLDNAGKTTIVKRLNGEDITTISPTLGFNIKTMQFKEFKLNIWDVGGQKTLRPYWRNYYEKTDGLIWVVDSADLARLEDCRAELQALLQEERLVGATLLVFANKQDVPSALAVEELSKVLDFASISKRHCRILACSAVTGEGILEGFDWLVKDISSRIYLFDH
mmetsp:Transcript_14759/g.32072  ORF Transcript_14759/g.32072 Transcript_14759/m.32072 type:complete len:186 (-) Transcript_14759:645-1202(-)|eukprot:CAMPEP_0202896118 /NCGR_PEP_ID=MMETSP1392-20130828/5178_1 /ASSEMBLY_ACC=CAM_ASM_000868 /TAXON_ID=225041 /ORGANISM="Chlamydomonas chlamydogama, Strain SAG 11-48b" /LENGTH=185 /DNA_ID=CAMNT_0049581357 /DNA_START=133 /DNA_END=690 /DNA_ORIENTATION=-